MANKVLDYFYQIMQIPRESGNEDKMVAFLKDYANKNQFEFAVDGYKNVVIKKNTKQARPLILQSHTDMVCVCEKGLKFDFAKNGIIPVIDGNFLRAKGTSLGADNGIGVSMILALMGEDFPMNIEAVFTSEEETTMNGAKNFDVSLLKGKHLLSLDGSDESVIETASASSIDAVFELGNLPKTDVKNNLFSVEISGLIGGHSGQDIDKNRGHAIKILVQFLSLVSDAKIVSIDAKEKGNVIPTSAKATFETALSQNELNLILQNFFDQTFMRIYAPKLKIEVTQQPKTLFTKSYENSYEIIRFLNKIKYEVLKEEQGGLVVLSSNLYHIDLENGKIYISIRGADEFEEAPYLSSLKWLANANEYHFKIMNYLPALPYQEKSKLRELLIQTHEACYKTKPKIEKIHAGLEAGFFSKKMPDADINIIAPQIYDLHSTQERVELDSIDRTYEWLKQTVQAFK